MVNSIIEKQEEIKESKARFLSDNSSVIINNFELMSYPLFKILSSDESLDKCEDREKIIEMSSNSKKTYVSSIRDEIYVLNTLAAFLDRIPLPYDEKMEAKQKVLGYTRYFNEDSRRAS